MINEHIKCPFCDNIILNKDDEDINISPCFHYIGLSTEYRYGGEHWGDEGVIDGGERYIEEIDKFVDKYKSDYKKEITSIINKYSFSKYYLIEKNIELEEAIFKASISLEKNANNIHKLEKQIVLTTTDDEGYGPGLGGEIYCIFIKDIEKVRWIFNDLLDIYFDLKGFDEKK